MLLQRYLAQCGVASRRKCEEIIASGRVTVNGEQIVQMGFEVDEEKDSVTVDGKTVTPVMLHTYWLMHKPRGVMTTLYDPQGRKTIVDLLPGGAPRLFPVGRLDYDTSGLLLLTDDGDLSFALMHPRHRIYKTYCARIAGKLTPEQAQRLREGLPLDGRMTAPAKVRILRSNAIYSDIEIAIREGRNRQIRRMCEAVGHEVVSLERTAMGPLTLGTLPIGAVRPLTDEELRQIKQVCGLHA